VIEKGKEKEKKQKVREGGLSVRGAVALVAFLLFHGEEEVALFFLFTDLAGCHCLGGNGPVKTRGSY
jgi:hypothetical protein